MLSVVEPAECRCCKRQVVVILGLVDELFDADVLADPVARPLEQVCGGQPGDATFAIGKGVDAQQVQREHCDDQQRMGLVVAQRRVRAGDEFVRVERRLLPCDRGDRRSAGVRCVLADNSVSAASMQEGDT